MIEASDKYGRRAKLRLPAFGSDKEVGVPVNSGLSISGRVQRETARGQR